MARKDYPESPVDALFSLASMVRERYNDIKFMGAYAYIFISIITALLLFLFYIGLKSHYIGLSLIALSLIIAGLVLLRMIVIISRFIRYFVSRFEVINELRNRDIFVPVPEGKDPLERAKNYIVSNEENFKSATIREIQINGRRGYIIRGRGIFSPYILLLEGKDMELKEITAIERDITSVVRKYGIPSRLVIVYTARKYDGLPEGLYTYIIEGKAAVMRRGKEYHLPLQVMVEFDGKYDIIPPVMA